MSGEDERISTYAEFRDNVLPRIKAQGYTAIQLMAIQVCGVRGVGGVRGVDNFGTTGCTHQGTGIHSHSAQGHTGGCGQVLRFGGGMAGEGL